MVFLNSAGPSFVKINCMKYRRNINIPQPQQPPSPPLLEEVLNTIIYSGIAQELGDALFRRLARLPRSLTPLNRALGRKVLGDLDVKIYSIDDNEARVGILLYLDEDIDPDDMEDPFIRNMLDEVVEKSTILISGVVEGQVSLESREIILSEERPHFRLQFLFRR